MLILARKPYEAVCIGPNIRVIVAGITKGTVRLAIDAPRDLHVDRLEVLLRKGAEEDASSHVPANA